MHIVIGATGRVGSAVARALLDRGEPVTVVTRDAARAAAFADRGAHVAEADIGDIAALRGVLQRGTRAFVLNPPAHPATDVVAEERRTAMALARAVAESGLEKVVVQSTYGAQRGDGIGDLGVLYELEQALGALPGHVSVVRGAYFMSNWEMAAGSARRDGIVHSFFPPDLALPMVAPADLGRVAARLLTDEASHTGIRYVEGPSVYSPTDVARAFATALERDVQVVPIPRDRWKETFQSFGFSPSAAASYARMTALTVDGGVEWPAQPERGPTTLAEYIAALVRSETAGRGSR